MASSAGETQEVSNAVHIWVRDETKEHEARAALTPLDCKDLLHNGLKISVEISQKRIFKDQEYEEVGCTLVPTGSWTDAPKEAFIVGIKELPPGSFPLTHRHIYFAHVYNNQEGWKELLTRFKQGGGTLIDVEWMRFKDGRLAVSEFSRYAGGLGAALGLELWIHRKLQKEERFSVPFHYQSEDVVIERVKSCIQNVWLNNEAMKNRPKILIAGAFGRCGRGAASMLCEKIGLNESQVVLWGSEETKKGGPFEEILDFDIFINCIFLNTSAKSTPIFLVEKMLKTKERNLSVLVDISCDSNNPKNPLPFVKSNTNVRDPVRSLEFGDGAKPLDIIAIGNLPSMLPREASTGHSAKLARQILELKAMDRSETLLTSLEKFREKTANI